MPAVFAGVGGTIEWHDLALQWQTPEVGEQVMEMMTPALGGHWAIFVRPLETARLLEEHWG